MDKVNAASGAQNVGGQPLLDGSNSPKKPSPMGMGADHGGIHPPPKSGEGLTGLFYEVLGFIKKCFNEIHDNIFFCVESKSSAAPHGGRVGGGENIVAKILQKWFPDQVTLYPNDKHETMIVELGKLKSDEYQLIVKAFNQATGKELPLDTTPQVLINEHLEEPTVLSASLFVGNEHLLRPYGSDQADLQTDLDRLENAIKEELKRYITVEEQEGPLSNYYKDHMEDLKFVLARL